VLFAKLADSRNKRCKVVSSSFAVKAFSSKPSKAFKMVQSKTVIISSFKQLKAASKIGAALT